MGLGNPAVGAYYLRAIAQANSVGVICTPYARNAGWDFTRIGNAKTPPTINLYAYEEDEMSYLYLKLVTTYDAHFFYTDLHPKISTADKWVHFSYPIGPYYKNNTLAEDPFTWSTTGTPSWSNINFVEFRWTRPSDPYNAIHIDDLHFEGLVCRVAYNSTNIASKKLKVHTITDNIGLDDSMTTSDDSYTMAKLAYAELLRQQKPAMTGNITVSMLKDVLPGQWFHIHAKKTSATGSTFRIDKDMRVPRLTQIIGAGKNSYLTTLELSDDLTNTHTRLPYEDVGKLLGAARPEYQDRQATSIKAGQIDITIPRLEKDYPS
jgi:hypothetical protein